MTSSSFPGPLALAPNLLGLLTLSSARWRAAVWKPGQNARPTGSLSFNNGLFQVWFALLHTSKGMGLNGLWLRSSSTSSVCIKGSLMWS